MRKEVTGNECVLNNWYLQAYYTYRSAVARKLCTVPSVLQAAVEEVLVTCKIYDNHIVLEWIDLEVEQTFYILCSDGKMYIATDVTERDW